jgi:hypothetical protein
MVGNLIDPNTHPFRRREKNSQFASIIASPVDRYSPSIGKNAELLTPECR